MRSARSLTLVLALGSLATLGTGCNTHEARAQPAKPAPAARDSRALCIEVFTKARTCTSDYIPALVDSRARHDNPPGITEAVKTDRDAVIAEAMKEWETDSTDESIGATCDKVHSQLGSEAETIEGCVALSECTEYTTCVMPLFEKRFSK